MPSLCAASSAFFKSREAIAVISLHAPFCIPGITLRTAIDAAPRIPHFTFFILSSVASSRRPALHSALSVIKPSALFLYTTSIKIGSLDYNVLRLALEESMTADRVEVSWDPGKSKWLVRIQSGEEVIRRYCNASKNADEQALRATAEQTVRDEGYQLAPSGVTIRRESAAAR